MGITTPSTTFLWTARSPRLSSGILARVVGGRITLQLEKLASLG
jgi:hypothetical protein